MSSNLFATQTPTALAIPISNGSGVLDPEWIPDSPEPVIMPAFTVAGLPAAASNQYGFAFITDGSATAITGLGLPAVGGGSNKIPVYSDGTQWLMI
jgi:hypothetical protein